MLFLKQSTAVTVKIGPFLDSTDGNTQETGLTISQADVLLSKNGGALTQKTEATTCTHDAVGVYGCPLDATDTGTLGRLQLNVHESGALAVWHEYMVVTANVYDSIVGGADYLDVATAELANIDLSTTMKASVNTEVDNALNTAIPAVNTADSINDILLDTLGTDVWATAARALTDKTGFTISGTKTTLDALNDITAASVWAVAARALTDKAGFSLAADQSAVTIGTVNTATALTTNNDKTGYALSATGIDSIVDEVIEGTTTLRQAIKLISSALFAKSSGGGTATLVFRDIGDSKPRITATVDANGNRTAMTLDAT